MWCWSHKWLFFIVHIQQYYVVDNKLISYTDVNKLYVVSNSLYHERGSLEENIQIFRTWEFVLKLKVAEDVYFWRTISIKSAVWY